MKSARSFVDQNRSKSTMVRFRYSRVAFHRNLINCQSLAAARSLSRQILYGARLGENRVHGLLDQSGIYNLPPGYFSMYVRLHRARLLGINHPSVDFSPSKRRAGVRIRQPLLQSAFTLGPFSREFCSLRLKQQFGTSEAFSLSIIYLSMFHSSTYILDRIYFLKMLN